MRHLFKDREHLLRVTGLFLGGLVIFFVARALLVPKGFGVYGHYRAGALKDARAQQPQFAGAKACADCHGDVATEKAAGSHKGLACESCHGPLAKHAAEPSSLKPERPDIEELCLLCHRENAARPPKFPQINPKEHAGTTPCRECHMPHSPGIDQGVQAPPAETQKEGALK